MSPLPSEAIMRVVSTVRRQPSKIIAAWGMFGVVVGACVVFLGADWDAGVGPTLLALVFLAIPFALVAYLFYRLWASPTRAVLIVLILFVVSTSVTYAWSDGIGSIPWWSWIADAATLGLAYLAWHEPRVVERTRKLSDKPRPDW
jgi:hypothetical protein